MCVGGLLDAGGCYSEWLVESGAMYGRIMRFTKFAGPRSNLLDLLSKCTGSIRELKLRSIMAYYLKLLAWNLLGWKLVG